MIYGNCYAAQSEYYARIKGKISAGISEIQEVEFAETKELGRVNKVDPLGITYLRIRGMWGIDNPINVYDYLNIDFEYLKKDNRFQLIAIIPEDKYLSLLEHKTLKFIENNEVVISKSRIKSPNNPAQMTNVRIISYVK